MGKEQPSRTSPLGRMKNKRMVVATTAAGAVLIAGGTAGAAVVGGVGGDPGAAANNASIPAAETAEPEEPAAPTPADGNDQARAEEQRDDASKAANQSFDAATVQHEEQEQSEDAEDGSSEAGPTGEGGSCEASMYSDPQPTANGETFDPGAMTAAHKELPFDTMVEVTNPDNGESVTVRINDRGPFIEGRCLDLSSASFETIASPDQGVVDVEWRVVE